jgi:hypothetical protein
LHSVQFGRNNRGVRSCRLLFRSRRILGNVKI